MNEVHVIVPEGIDDPARPSGGNTYDRRVCDGLAALGRDVREHAVPGAWPHGGAGGHAALARVLGRIRRGGRVLIDGLIASAAPEELAGEAGRLRLTVLVHMPLGHRPPAGAAVVREREDAALAAAGAVITTSEWARGRLQELYGLPGERIHVAAPGVDPARAAVASPAGDRLLCVAAVSREKGHDVLLEALAALTDLSWSCTCVGGLDRDPAFAAAAQRRGGRVRFLGPRTGPALARAYADSDLLLLPSRAETYGMVVTEALARGIPVLASDVGGVREALGAGGVLLPPGDPVALAAALRGWLGDAGLRGRLRAAARERRAQLRGWPDTVAAVAGAIEATDVLEAAAR